jgi:hypothetical protein
VLLKRIKEIQIERRLDLHRHYKWLWGLKSFGHPKRSRKFGCYESFGHLLGYLMHSYGVEELEIRAADIKP